MSKVWIVGDGRWEQIDLLHQFRRLAVRWEQRLDITTASSASPAS